MGGDKARAWRALRRVQWRRRGTGLAQQTKAAPQTPQHLAVAREDLQQRQSAGGSPSRRPSRPGRRQLPPVSRRQYTWRADPRLGARSAAAGSPK